MRDAVLAPPAPLLLAAGLMLSLSDLNALRMFPGSGRFFSLKDTKCLLSLTELGREQQEIPDAQIF